MARPTLFSNRKLLKLAQRLQSRALAVGTLELIWHAANETGNPVLGDADDVEAMADHRGTRGDLVAALIECGSNGGDGFLFRRPDGRYEIHDYWHHAPDYVRKRADRERKRRETGDELRGADRSDEGTTPAADQSLTGQCPVSDQSLTGQNAVGSPEKGDFGRTPAPAPAPAPAPNSPTAAKPPRVKRSRNPDPDWLPEFKREYPDRLGGQEWRRAVRAANSRIEEGHTPAQFIAGAHRYREHCKALEKIGTQYVKQAATFLGPDKYFLEPWPVPKPVNGAPTRHPLP